MPFDEKRFLSGQWEYPTEDVPVPELSDWFDENEPAIWTVRGLDGVELARAAEIASRRNLSLAILEGLMSMKGEDVKLAIQRYIGQSNDIPEETAKRIQYLQMGSVKPLCNEELAVEINKRKGVTFLNLTNRIITLSGQGMIPPGKSKPFGKTSKSKRD